MDKEVLTKFPKNYVNVRGAVKYLNQIFDIDFNGFKLGDINKALLTSKTMDIKYVKHNNRHIPVYYIGVFNGMIKRPYDYEERIVTLGMSLEKYCNIEIFKTVPYKPISWDDVPVDEPYDETSMEYCNQQLLKKYQTESIVKSKKIFITEEQFNKLLTIVK